MPQVRSLKKTGIPQNFFADIDIIATPAAVVIGSFRLKFAYVLVSCPINNVAFAVGQLAVFQGASEAPISGSYGSSEQRGKTANWPRPGGLR